MYEGERERRCMVYRITSCCVIRDSSPGHNNIPVSHFHPILSEEE